MHVNKDEMCANVRENTRCEGVLFTPPVGYSGSLSAVNETNCNKKEIRAKKNCELVGQLERRTGILQRKLLVLVVCVFVDLDGDALQFVLLIRGVSDFSL